MAMKKNETSTARGIAKRHRKNLDTENVKAITDQTTVLNSDRPLQNPLELEKSVSESPLIDTKRVEKIRSAIEKGEYKIDSTRTADKLLKLEDDIWGDK